MPKQKRGFAAMSQEKQRQIARKGGLTVSRNRKHMSEIGKLGASRKRKKKKGAKHGRR